MLCETHTIRCVEKMGDCLWGGGGVAGVAAPPDVLVTAHVAKSEESS